MENLKKKVQNVFETSYSSKCLKALDNIKKNIKNRENRNVLHRCKWWKYFFNAQTRDYTKLF